ncbi:MAG TPA: flagellar hook-associated protein FlgL [Candidatus Binatia bacterium]|jgi:flagellar hook-associated protein 3 FlgL
MRVTTQSLSNQVQESLQQAFQRMSQTQEAISSGKRINRLADDPFGAVRAIDLGNVAASLDQYDKNISSALPVLNQTDAVLGDVSDALNRAKELAVAMANGTLSSQDRAAAAGEAHQLFLRLVSLGNTKLENRYLFAGFKNGTAAFTEAAGVVTYNGDGGEIKIQANSSTDVAINLPGDKVFQGVGVIGGTDIFDALFDLETALNANDVSGANGINTQIGRLSKALDQVGSFRAEIGSRLGTLDAAGKALEVMKLGTTEMRSKIEDVDPLTAYSDFARLQQAFQAALQSSARVIQPSILDFLR